MKRLLPLFALLAFASVGTLSAQTRDQEIERLKAEIARLKGNSAARPEDIEKLHKEAGALFQQGKYREAKAKATQAYAAFERLPVKDKATRVRHLRVLCNISDALRENDQTIEYAIEVTTHAVDDDDRAFAYNLLGQAYNWQAEYDKAIEYYEKSLAIGLKIHGAESSEVGVDFNNIGLAYDNKGEHDKAIGYYEQALPIYLKTLGPEHPEVATTYNNIGLAYSNKGEYDKAIRYYEKTLAILLKTLDPEHPHVALTYYNIGRTMVLTKGDKRTAMRYLLKAKAILLKRLGPNHPSTKNTQWWIDKVNRE